MAGINIPFLSNVRDFLRGTSDVEGALDDVADSLDDMGRDAQAAARDAERALDDVADAGTNVGDDIKDAGRDAERALDDVAQQAAKTGTEIESEIETAARAAGDEAEKMERSFKDAFDTVSKKAKDAGDDIDKNTRQGTGRGGEAIGEFKQEAVSNFSEVASSFQGDMTSAVDGVQGLLGGLAGSSIPGVGIAAGIAGLAMGAAFAGAQEEADKTRERIDRLREAFTETESTVKGTDEVWRETIAEWGDPMTALGDNIVAVQDKIKAMGFDAEETDTIIRGIAGAPEDIRKAQKLLTDEIARTDKKYRDMGGGIDLSSASAENALKGIKKELDKTVNLQAQATAEYEAQERLLGKQPGAIEAAGRQQEAYLESLTKKKRTIEVDISLDDAKRKVAAWRPSVVLDVHPRNGKQVR